MGTQIKNDITLESTFERPMFAGQVSSISESGHFLINGHIKTQQALSCLISPCVGDTVLYWKDSQNHGWIISVLSGEKHQERELSLPNNASIKVNTTSLTVNASDSIKMNAIKEINLNVALGKLNECARSIYQMVQGTLVQCTKQLINRSEYLDFHAEKLLKSHAAQQLITAEKDIKMDADRINMG
ncbi:DUF3540 domain-containing protein [Planctobacterium marinum]|uniref:DUF3540 domain-containing protein n=1 Tax=Planctobacterium marinum TaxID=1631968 RepID=UPI003618C405